MIYEELIENIDKYTNPNQKRFIIEELSQYPYMIIKDEKTFIYRVPEFQNINPHYFGLYIRLCNHDISVWIATEDFNSGFGLGEFDYNIELTNIIQKSLENANICDFCNTKVGLSNLHRVAFANKSCPNCLESARKKLEYNGWNN